MIKVMDVRDRGWVWASAATALQMAIYLALRSKSILFAEG
jgi:hypothetical protein